MLVSWMVGREKPQTSLITPVIIKNKNVWFSADIAPPGDQEIAVSFLLIYFSHPSKAGQTSRVETMA